MDETRIINFLERIAIAIESQAGIAKQEGGFSDSPYTGEANAEFIYLGGASAGETGWYFLKDGTPIPIQEKYLHGKLVDISTYKTTIQDKEVTKLLVKIDTGSMVYALRTAIGSWTCASLLLSLDAIAADRLKLNMAFGCEKYDRTIFIKLCVDGNYIIVPYTELGVTKSSIGGINWQTYIDRINARIAGEDIPPAVYRTQQQQQERSPQDQQQPAPSRHKTNLTPLQETNSWKHYKGMLDQSTDYEGIKAADKYLDNLRRDRPEFDQFYPNAATEFMNLKSQALARLSQQATV